MTTKEALDTWANGNYKDVINNLIELSKEGKHGCAERFANEIYNKFSKQDKQIFFKLILGQMISSTEQVENLHQNAAGADL